ATTECTRSTARGYGSSTPARTSGSHGHPATQTPHGGDGPHEPVPTQAHRESTLGERSQVQLDHIRIVQQIRTRSRIRVTALVQNITSVTDLQAKPGILLHHHHRHTRGVDLLDPLEDVLL